MLSLRFALRLEKATRRGNHWIEEIGFWGWVCGIDIHKFDGNSILG